MIEKPKYFLAQLQLNRLKPSCLETYYYMVWYYNIGPSKEDVLLKWQPLPTDLERTLLQNRRT
jgi:hypothetical protein